MNKLCRFAALPLLALSGAAMAENPGADALTAMGTAVDFTTVIAVLGTVFAALIGYVLFKNGGLAIFNFIRGHAK